MIKLNFTYSPLKTTFLVNNSFKNIGTIDLILRKGLPNTSQLDKCGIYAIAIPHHYSVKFFDPPQASTNGNVIKPWTIEKLKQKWVDTAEIVYYGLAGRNAPRPLRERLYDLIDHGNGNITDRGPHYGGEIIWQLNGYETFDVWILETGYPPEPRKYESELLQDFFRVVGKLPFANRRF